MLKMKIDSSKIDFSGNNKLVINLPEELGNIRIVDAVLNIRVKSVTNAKNGYFVNFACFGENEVKKSSWSNIDFIEGVEAGQILKINISDELQDSINHSAKKVELSFKSKAEDESSAESFISFEKDEDNDFIEIDYISLSEYQENSASKTVDLKDAGTLDVNLLSGELSLEVEVVSSDQNILPLCITNNYSNFEDENGKKNNLNISQYLAENKSTDGSLSFTYIDAKGKSQIIKETYYYEEDGQKKTVARGELKVDLDGTLKTKEGEKEVKTELVAPSGLKLVSSIEGLEGSDLVDFKPEELANLEIQINELQKSNEEYADAIKNNEKQICVYALSKEAFEKQLKVQKDSVEGNEKNIKIQKLVEFIHAENSRKNRNFTLPNANEEQGYAREYFGSNRVTEDNIESIGKYLGEKKAFYVYGNKEMQTDDVRVVSTILFNEASSLLNLGLDYEYDKATQSVKVNSGLLKSQEDSQKLSELLYSHEVNEEEFKNLVKNALSSYKTAEGESLNLEEFGLDDAKLEEIYSKFTSKESLKLSLKDLISIDMQINSLISNNLKYQKKIDEQNKLLEKYLYQQKLYEMQVPVHYLYDENNVVYGFGKTEDSNRFRLVLIMDSYKNAISINYESLESDKIKNIIDSAEKVISFEYKNDRLSSIIDARERVTSFEYDNAGNIVKIIKGDGSVSRYFYADDKLSAVINSSGFGAKITYDEKKVIKVEVFSLLKEIKNGKAEFKIDPEVVEDFTPYLIKKGCFEIKYISSKSTKITSGNGKSQIFVCDKHGKIVTIYKNEFSENDEKIGVLATNFEYQNSKISLKTSPLPCSENLLKGSCFNNESIKNVEALYLGEGTFCSEFTLPYSYKTCDKIHMISAEKTDKIDVMNMNEDQIKRINLGSEICSHKTFVVSGWAKADSAFVADDGDYDATFGTKLEGLDEGVEASKRRFRIVVKVEFLGGKLREFSRSFDWRNTDWQYCSLPVRLSDGEVKSIKCYIDYSNNIGDLSYTDLEFKEGEFELTKYDESNNIISFESGHSNWIKLYEYNENGKLKKVVLTDKTDTKKSYETSFEYNKNGKLLKTINYDGIVQENVYNDKGIVVKTITYNNREPALKFYEEKILDEKGKVEKSVNELGEETSKFKYLDGTNIVSETLDEAGIKTTFGYGANDVLLQASTFEGGFNNTNTYGYELGFLTSLKSNNFEINYDYDGEGRVTEVKIAGEKYLSKTYANAENNGDYANDEEVTSLANGEEFKQIFDAEGNVLSTLYKKDLNSDWEEISKNLYDSNGNLIYTKDCLDNGNEHKLSINKFGKIDGQTETQHGEKLTIKNTYDENHNNVIGTSISIGSDEKSYAYHYTNDYDQKLFAVDLPNGETQTIGQDSLGRTNKISAKWQSKELEYLSVGDHTSNLVSSEKFLAENATNESIKYKYDAKGNITEIRKNNELISRYKYDGLSRLVREDNRALNKTMAYCYDAGGNILCRTEYAFTLVDNLDFETGTNFNYSYSANGWRDQLKSYNGERFIYDELGNPMLYRNEVLSWSHGRRLDKFGDIEFTYNANGIRTGKTVNGVTTNFYLNGTKILKQTDGTNELEFYYGADGVLGFHLKNNDIDADYYYKKNILGDVIGILDNTGKELASYVYDAWGNHKTLVLSKNGDDDIFASSEEYNDNNKFENNKFIADINPFRYRSYYFDTETKLYYLNSRYYDCETGRFINSDDISVLNISQVELNGLNLYSYCLNNPVNTSDEDGNIPRWLKWLIGGVVIAAAAIATVVTGGAAAGTIVAAVHTVAVSALTTGVTSAIVGSISSGLEISNGSLTWNWDRVADGFMEGALFGTAAGIMSSVMVGVGSNLPKFMYRNAQILVNASISASLTFVQKAISGNLSKGDILISAVFGGIGGSLGSTNIGNIKNFLLGFGLELTESFIENVYNFIKDGFGRKQLINITNTKRLF